MGIIFLIIYQFQLEKKMNGLNNKFLKKMFAIFGVIGKGIPQISLYITRLKKIKQGRKVFLGIFKITFFSCDLIREKALANERLGLANIASGGTRLTISSEQSLLK